MEKKVTKRITGLSVLLLAFTAFSAVAQVDEAAKKKTCDAAMNKTKYIFEGKPISSETFRGTDGVYYTAYLMEISNVVKGELQKGTVEILTEATHYVEKVKDTTFPNGLIKSGNTTAIVHDAVQPVSPGVALYFCQDLEKSVGNSGLVKTNPTTLITIDAVSFSNDKVIPHLPRVTMFTYFTKKNDVYDYFKKEYSITLEKKSTSNAIVKKVQSKTHAEWVQDVQKRKQLSNSTSSLGCTELFISEYLEGKANNKVIEIYNPSASAISLSNYKLMIFHGSSLIPTVIQLVGTIGSKSTFVVANTHANASVLSVAGQTDNNCMFNGTEAIVLEKNTVYIDKIGQVGILIVRGWAIPPSGSTDDMDLRRKYTVSMGDTAWANCQNEWDYFPNDSLANIGIYQNICGVDPDLNLSFANPVIAGGYFEFDIMATSTGANTYLDNSPIDIRYNSAVFGTHAVAGGRVTVTLGSSFNASTYLSPMFGIGDGVDSIAVGFSSDNSASSWNRTLITSTPIQLLHYKIQILNCGNSAGIQFFNQSFTTSFSWYVANANDNPNTATTFPYTNVNEGAALNTSIPPCTPAITDFNSPMRAGIGEILTITGSNFGSARGNGQVKFTNADNGGASYLQHLNATDYLNWSNTQIQITLPNFVDSIFPSPNQLSQISIGGGNFIVTTNAGDSIVSANNMAGNPFKIFYNLLQTRNNTAQVKKRINLTKSDTSGGYMFRLNPTDFPAGSNQRYVFTNAARDWRCMTGVNITIGPDITITYKPDSIDGINYVCFSNLLTISSALAKTTTHVFGCTNGVVANQETDMQFNNTASIFAYDTNATHNIPASQYDFYEVCSHEIGHVVGLAHNVVPTDLMFWSEGTGVTAANRKRLVAGSSPDSGGVYSVTKSISTPLGCWSVMSLGQCQNPNGINQYVNNSLFAIYPNPANDFITVEFRNPLNKETQIAIIDVLGHVVKQIRVQTTKTYIDIGNLSSGAYVIQINGSYTKLIKN